MSCYEWERGSIKLPTAEYPKVRDAIIEVHNRRQERLYNLAVQTYDALKTAVKGKRGIKLVSLLDELTAESIALEKKISIGGLRFFYRLGWEDQERISNSVFPHDKWDTKKDINKVFKPKKKEFAKANKSTTTFRADMGTITFDAKTKTVHWDVEENNHACQSSRNHPLGEAFFAALRRVTWTNRSGGFIFGNDEYNRDEGEYRPGGGGSYIKDRFGGLGEKASAPTY